MTQKCYLTLIAGFFLGLSACAPTESGPTILDAATIYNAQEDRFTEILDSQMGPVAEFTRIPARDPAKEIVANKALLKRLRKVMPIEFIDFFPRAAAGRDEINVIIKRYGINTDWTVVGLIYLSEPLSQPDDKPNDVLFDQCDDRSLQWIEDKAKSGPVSVFCKLNANWYAFQTVG